MVMLLGSGCYYSLPQSIQGLIQPQMGFIQIGQGSLEFIGYSVAVIYEYIPDGIQRIHLLLQTTPAESIFGAQNSQLFDQRA